MIMMMFMISEDKVLLLKQNFIFGFVAFIILVLKWVLTIALTNVGGKEIEKGLTFLVDDQR